MSRYRLLQNDQNTPRTAAKTMDGHRTLSRRRAVVRLGTGGLGAVVAAGGLAASAQEATPPAAQEDLPPVLAGWVEAWEALDANAIAGAFAEDGIHEDVPLNETFHGREEIQEHFALLTTEFTDTSADVTNVIAGGDGAAVEWVYTGSYTGQVFGFPPGNGEQVMIRGTLVLELADGQIQLAREYYDVFGVLVQVGLLPAPGATPSAQRSVSIP